MATGVVTPEAVVLDLSPASPGSRVLARVLDIVVTALALMFGLFVVLAIAAVGPGSVGATALAIFSSAGSFAAVLVYPVLMESLWKGRTPGKAALGLRVVRTDGGPIGFRHAAIRAGLGLIEVWGTFGSLGFLVMLFSRREQRLGDMAAGTLVLRERQGGTLRPVRLLVPPGCEQLVMTMDVGSMSADDYELVRSFLVRWRDFAGPQRATVAATLAGPLWQRFRHPIPAGLGPDYYLACLGAAYQYRHHSGPYGAAQAAEPSVLVPPPPPRNQGGPGDWAAPR
ncbi:MAG: RDD family protein [Acidimicrobiales bacterium]|jgi:uncharacterized RDD family membrane protein YckC